MKYTCCVCVIIESYLLQFSAIECSEKTTLSLKIERKKTFVHEKLKIIMHNNYLKYIQYAVDQESSNFLR